MKLFRNRSLWALPALLIFAGGCGKDTATSPTDTTTTTASAAVTATADPETVIVAASSDGAYAWSGSFTVTIRNTDASPLTIKSITADLQQSTAGIVITPIEGTDESFRFDVRAPGNRIDLNGTLDLPFTFYYTLPNGGREALITLSFSATSDAGGAGAVTTTVSLQ